MNPKEEFMVIGVNPELPREPKLSRILIVEDDNHWQMAIQRAIHRIDRRIHTSVASDANRALEILGQNEKFDLIISDYNLGEAKTGLDLYDILLRRNSEIPYLLLSGMKRERLVEMLMPYRREMFPLFQEKPGSVRELSAILSSSFL